jgi:hypothetical protein
MHPDSQSQPVENNQIAPCPEQRETRIFCTHRVNLARPADLNFSRPDKPVMPFPPDALFCAWRYASLLDAPDDGIVFLVAILAHP